MDLGIKINGELDDGTYIIIEFGWDFFPTLPIMFLIKTSL